MSDEKKLEDIERQKKIDLTNEILKRAREGVHSEFQFLHNLAELRATKVCIKAQTQLVQGLEKSAASCMQAYRDLISAGEDNLQLILSYKELLGCIKFYSDEIAILKDMRKEYICYVHSNHLVQTFLNIDRPVQDEIDWRKLPIKLF